MTGGIVSEPEARLGTVSASLVDAMARMRGDRAQLLSTTFPTGHPPFETTSSAVPRVVGEPTVPPPADPTPRRPAAQRSNPVRIERIDTARIQVSIRPALDDAELDVLVDRLEQLIDAGYDSIEVVFEGSDAADDPARSTERSRR